MSTTYDVVAGNARTAHTPGSPDTRVSDRSVLLGKLTFGRHRHLPEWLYRALLIALISTSIGLAHAIVEFLQNHTLAGCITRMMDAWSWGVLFPLILAVDKRLPLPDRQLSLRVGTYLLLSIPIVTAHVLIESTAELPISTITWSPFRSSYNTYYYFWGGWVAYCAIVGVLHAFRYYGRLNASQLHLVQVEKQLLQARLHSLHMQLEPHFIMNALNTISSEVECNPILSRQMIEDIGVLLRLSHEYKDRQLIPLVEELALLDHYLAIQKVRFGDRLRIETRIAPEARFVCVPCLLLQPLVENAIRHGLEGTKSGGTIRLLADRVGSEMEIRLEDDGEGLPSGWQIEASSGQGLTITRERLAVLYPKGTARIAVRPRHGRGTEVLVSFPVQAAEEEP